MNFKHGHCPITGKRSPTLASWHEMWRRVSDPSRHRYERYGGRGITVCDRWKDFNTFLADLGEKPSSEHSLERIDNNGNYEPANCRWATRKEQCRNRRTSKLLVFNGETKTLVEWCESLGLNYARTLARLDKLNWSVERAFTTPKLC